MAHAWSRRAFLRMGSAVGTTVGATAFAGASSLVNVLAASQSVAHRSAEDVAQDEFYWREVQLAFKLDRSLTNLNNGFTCPCPRVVHRIGMALSGHGQHAAGPLSDHGRAAISRRSAAGWQRSSGAARMNWR